MMNLLFAMLLPLLIDPEPASSTELLRLATFNIHHAEGTDGNLDVGRVVKVVHDSDVIAFQEVDVRFGERSQFADQAEELAKALGGEVAFGGNLIRDKGAYGVALVSKYPILAKRNHPLPRSAGRENAEPRGLLEVTIDVKGRPIRVYVTHLAHDSAADRRLQVEAVRKVIASKSGPAILMGDLNFRPESDHYKRLLAAEAEMPALLVDSWTQVGKGNGHSIGLKGKSPGRIDYILVSPDLADGLEEIHVDTETIASDHQPVLAELRLKPVAPRTTSTSSSPSRVSP
ncbi:endonuclease/exonuclease/phosphatase family protein [Singulisphaera sp. Ch08]|uniref:Endonuclease/exonuclease/phosphatase family protein n=1 Tax=Singulisphaera sp. Ch08 TaxID=3120278 RepID=A0AAU7CFK5_9BACT